MKGELSRLTAGFWVDSEAIDEKHLKEIQAMLGKIMASVLDVINMFCETFKWRCRSGNQNLVSGWGSGWIVDLGVFNV